MTTAPHETAAPTAKGRAVEAVRESPAGHLAEACAAASVAGVVTLRELPFLPQAEIRARNEETATRALGPLPAPGRALAHAGYTLLWCGPAWYLAVAEPAGPPGVLPWDVDGPGLDVVDTSAARTTLELRGPHARDVLAHGCRVDLHPRAFPPGATTRTLLARSTVVVHHPDVDAYRVYAGASYADHLTRWLLDAMTPYVS